MANSEDRPSDEREGAGTPPSDPQPEPRVDDEKPYSSGDWSSSGTLDSRGPSVEPPPAEPAAQEVVATVVEEPPPAASVPATPPPVKPPPPPEPPDDGDDEGMAKMSFID